MISHKEVAKSHLIWPNWVSIQQFRRKGDGFVVMTQCTQTEIEFEAHFARSVVARFDGGTMTSDGGALLARRTDRQLNLLPRLAACFRDERNDRYC